VLVLAGVFTISNVIRLTVYAREDELDIMQLVGATQAYVKGPFVVEGMIQGGLGGILSVGLLWFAVRWLTADLAAGSAILGRTPIGLPSGLSAMLILGGMAVGVVGSLVSLRRVRV
jgi:cell division transport system permease protein